MDTYWDTSEVYTYRVTANSNFEINYIGTQDIGLGDYGDSKFDIAITGSFNTLSISLNGKTLTYNQPVNNKTIVIDNVNATVRMDGNNVLYNVSGDIGEFLKLTPGINNIRITGTGLNCSVLFDFRPQYL